MNLASTASLLAQLAAAAFYAFGMYAKLEVHVWLYELSKAQLDKTRAVLNASSWTEYMHTLKIVK